MFEDCFVIPIMFLIYSSIIIRPSWRSLQFDLIFFLVLLRTKNFVARSCSFVWLEFNVNVARINEEIIRFKNVKNVLIQFLSLQIYYFLKAIIFFSIISVNRTNYIFKDRDWPFLIVKFHNYKSLQLRND